MASLLTKSSFTHFLNCPIRLWLEYVRKDLNPPYDAATEQLFAYGRQVDDLARELFPGGVVVAGYNLDGMKNTLAAIAGGARVLYQPTAVGNGLSARADILVKGRNGWDIHEVKMGTHVDEAEAHHVSDLAFQRLAFEAAGITIGKTFLTHIDNTYVREGEIDVTKLFVEEDITRDVKAATPEVLRQIPFAKKVLAWPRELEAKHLRTCPDLTKCEFVGYWLNAMPPRKREELLGELKPAVASGMLENLVANLDGISPAFLAKVGYRTPEERWPRSIKKAEIKERLDSLEYPLAFYDYETYRSPIPPFDGTWPYQQIPFQFSATVIDKPGAKPRTFDFLADKFEDTSSAVIAALREAIPETGTVVSWNQIFESGRNKELADAHPKYAKFLLGINARTFDLMLVFREKLYIDPACRGKANLKIVLPALVPSLSYKKLAIQEGETASASWAILTDPKLPAAKREKLRKDMIAYCQLDVLAMVEILGVLQKVVG